ncbi:MAG TPA: antitoxin Xre/MbcA/ParS toxin-binding domain-containing protein, partial [Vulgatibacter sp.]
ERPIPRIEAETVVLTKAILRAADKLGVSRKELARIVGTSPATLSRVVSGSSAFRPETKEGELGILFVRIFRSLDAILGGAEESSRAWLHSHNNHLQGVPLELIQSVRGLVGVAEYLDAMRGKA